MIRTVKRVSCMLLVARLDDARVLGDERRIIALLGRALPRVAWSRTVLVFTFAGNLPDPADFSQRLADCTSAFKQEIAKHIDDWQVVHAIPVVAVDNHAAAAHPTTDANGWARAAYGC